MEHASKRCHTNPHPRPLSSDVHPPKQDGVDAYACLLTPGSSFSRTLDTAKCISSVSLRLHAPGPNAIDPTLHGEVNYISRGLFTFHEGDECSRLALRAKLASDRTTRLDVLLVWMGCAWAGRPCATSQTCFDRRKAGRKIGSIRNMTTSSVYTSGHALCCAA